MSIVAHPTSIVSKDAEIGEDVQIGPYCIVDAKAKIGARTVLKAYSRVSGYTEVGEDCVFHEHAVIGGDPQDLGYKGEISWARLGNNVVCREFVTVNRATGENQETRINDNCFIMENVHVAHNVFIGRDCTIANKSGISGHVHIGDFAVIGGMSGFHQFVHIGSYCMVGGLSRITQDIPPFCLASGIPCRVYDINRVGLRRRGFTSESRRSIRDMYKIIYNSGRTIREGIEEVSNVYGDRDEAKILLRFAEESTRGFTPRMTQDWSKKSEEGSVD